MFDLTTHKEKQEAMCPAWEHLMLGIDCIKAEQKLFLGVQWGDFFVSQTLEVLKSKVIG